MLLSLLAGTVKCYAVVALTSSINLRPTKSIVWLSLLHKALFRQDMQSAVSTFLPHLACLCGGFQAGGTRRVAMLSLPTQHWESRQVLLLHCALLWRHRDTRASVKSQLIWFVYLFWTLRERNVSDAYNKWKTKTTKTKRPKLRNPNCKCCLKRSRGKPGAYLAPPHISIHVSVFTFHLPPTKQRRNLYWLSRIFQSCLAQAWGPSETLTVTHRSWNKFPAVCA